VPGASHVRSKFPPAIFQRASRRPTRVFQLINHCRHEWADHLRIYRWLRRIQFGTSNVLLISNPWWWWWDRADHLRLLNAIMQFNVQFFLAASVLSVKRLTFITRLFHVTESAEVLHYTNFICILLHYSLLYSRKAMGVGPPFRGAAIFSHFQHWQLTVRNTVRVRVRVRVSRLVVSISRTIPCNDHEWLISEWRTLRNGWPEPGHVGTLLALLCFLRDSHGNQKHWFGV